MAPIQWFAVPVTLCGHRNLLTLGSIHSVGRHTFIFVPNRRRMISRVRRSEIQDYPFLPSCLSTALTGCGILAHSTIGLTMRQSRPQLTVLLALPWLIIGY